MLHAFWSLTDALELSSARVLTNGSAAPHLPNARARLLPPPDRPRTHALWPAALLALVVFVAALALPRLRARSRHSPPPLPLTSP